MPGSHGSSARWPVLALAWLSACGAAPAPAPAEPAASETATFETAASEPVDPAPAPRCVTLRDAELGCTADCDDLMTAIRTCRARSAAGAIEVRWTWDGTRTDVALRIEGEHLEVPSRCVREQFERFVPCFPEEPQSGVLPIRFDP